MIEGEKETLIRKVVILIPLLVLAGLAGVITAVNMGESPVTEVQPEPEEVAEVEELEMSRHNPANPKSYGQLPGESAYDGTVAGFLAEVHQSWHELSTKEKYDSSVSSASYDIVKSVVPEINFLDAQLDSQWKWKFDALQETAHQLTSPVIELSQEERNELISVFEEDLNRLDEEFAGEPQV